MSRKSTKKSGAACNVSTGQSDVTRRQYNAALKKSSDRKEPKAVAAIAFLRAANRQARLDAEVAADAIEYQPPHISEYPPYGQRCWYEAWLEMTAWLALCVALDRYESARRSTGYMPPWVLQQYLTTLMTALADYSAAWYVLDNCLHGTPT